MQQISEKMKNEFISSLVREEYLRTLSSPCLDYYVDKVKNFKQRKMVEGIVNNGEEDIDYLHFCPLEGVFVSRVMGSYFLRVVQEAHPNSFHDMLRYTQAIDVDALRRGFDDFNMYEMVYALHQMNPNKIHARIKYDFKYKEYSYEPMNNVVSCVDPTFTYYDSNGGHLLFAVTGVFVSIRENMKIIDEKPGTYCRIVANAVRWISHQEVDRCNHSVLPIDDCRKENDDIVKNLIDDDNFEALYVDKSEKMCNPINVDVDFNQFEKENDQKIISVLLKLMADYHAIVNHSDTTIVFYSIPIFGILRDIDLLFPNASLSFINCKGVDYVRDTSRISVKILSLEETYVYLSEFQTKVVLVSCDDTNRFLNADDDYKLHLLLYTFVDLIVYPFRMNYEHTYSEDSGEPHVYRLAKKMRAKLQPLEKSRIRNPSTVAILRYDKIFIPPHRGYTNEIYVYLSNKKKIKYKPNMEWDVNDNFRFSVDAKSITLSNHNYNFVNSWFNTRLRFVGDCYDCLILHKLLIKVGVKLPMIYRSFYSMHLASLRGTDDLYDIIIDKGDKCECRVTSYRDTYKVKNYYFCRECSFSLSLFVHYNNNNHKLLDSRKESLLSTKKGMKRKKDVDDSERYIGSDSRRYYAMNVNTVNNYTFTTNSKYHIKATYTNHYNLQMMQKYNDQAVFFKHYDVYLSGFVFIPIVSNPLVSMGMLSPMVANKYLINIDD